MSRLYWTTRNKEVELLGMEAHWIHAIPSLAIEGYWRLESIVSSFSDSLLKPLAEAIETRNIFSGGSRPETLLKEVDEFLAERRSDPFRLASSIRQSLRLYLTSGISEARIRHQGGTFGVADINHNTAMVVGSPVIQFATKLSGYCEAHAFVEEEDRPWAAQLVRDGREMGIFRPRMGWEEVAEFLDAVEAHPGPVVTHYSVCESFPNPGVAGWEPEIAEGEHEDDAWDRWYELSDDEKWDMSLPKLRESWWLRISPDTMKPTFGHTVTIMDVLAGLSGAANGK